jgi:hypothetical protein
MSWRLRKEASIPGLGGGNDSALIMTDGSDRTGETKTRNFGKTFWLIPGSRDSLVETIAEKFFKSGLLLSLLRGRCKFGLNPFEKDKIEDTMEVVL